MSTQTSEQAELERLRDLTQRLKLEAQIHAQEARTANATIAEIYAAVTQHTGEPGNWHGAKPVIAELERLRAEVAALRRSRSHEHDIALREAHQITESDEFFKHRNWIFDTHHNRRIFEHGFIRGWKAAIDAAMSEQAMQELVDQAQELDMGYGERK